MADLVAPAVGASSGGSSGYPAGGAQVWRPGVSTVDPKTGKKVDVTGKLYTALYTVSDQAVFAELQKDLLKSNTDRNQLKAYMVQGGLLSKSNYQTAYWSSADTEAFKKLLGEANSAGGYTWQEMLPKLAGAGGGQPTTTTNKSYDISDPTTARGIVTSALRTLIGRDPDTATMNRLVKALTVAEQASPSITTQTQTGPGQYTTQSTGGMTIAGKQQAVTEAALADTALQPEIVNNRINQYGDVIAKLAAGR